MEQLTKYLIAVPCMDTVPLPFVASLTYMQRVGASRVTFHQNSMVYDARNALAAEAVDTGADRVLWLDSDMQFPTDTMQNLAADMDEGLDFVCGLYFRRKLPVAPVMSKRFDVWEEGGKLHGKSDIYYDYPKDQLFEIAANGFGAVMCSTKLIKDIFDNYGRPFDPIPGVMGEDFAFCWRAQQLGYKMYCDSRIKVGHVGLFNYTEQLYRRDDE